MKDTNMTFLSERKKKQKTFIHYTTYYYQSILDKSSD